MLKATTPIVRLERLNKSYPMGKSALHVLKDVDLSIERGEFVTIRGSSGSGKSTLLNVIGLLDNPSDGKYHFLDHEVSRYSERPG